MLYISRIRGTGARGNYEYGVVDTDDGIETFVSKQELEQICVNTGLKVEGAHRQLRRSICDSMSSSPGMAVTIGSIIPYQPPESVTVGQSKLLSVYGIRILTYKDFITYIGTCFSGQDRLITTRVRLSQYGKHCADCIVGYQSINIGQYELTLVIDDNISLSESTFIDAPVRLEDLYGGVRFDVCECSDSENVFRLYLKAARMLKLVHGQIDDVKLSIIDGQERFSYFMSLLRNETTMKVFGV